MNVLALAVSSANGALIGSWRQDEAAGNLVDSAGLHPPGTPTGSPTYGQSGVPNGTYGAINVTNAGGKAIEYGPSTVDEFFTTGTDNNNPVMNLDATGAFTVMGWMNPAAPTAGRSYRFLSTGSGAGPDRGWGIGLRLPNTTGTGSSIRFTTYGILDNDSSLFNVAFGNWVHIAATYDNGQINYFLNGNALDSDTSVFGNEGAAARLVVGGRLGGADTDQMNGLIDGVQVFNEVLTVDQIRQAAAASVVPEPSTMLLGVGVGCVALARRRRS
jgi:hypothetical protein